MLIYHRHRHRRVDIIDLHPGVTKGHFVHGFTVLSVLWHYFTQTRKLARDGPDTCHTCMRAFVNRGWTPPTYLHTDLLLASNSLYSFIMVFHRMRRMIFSWSPLLDFDQENQTSSSSNFMIIPRSLLSKSWETPQQQENKHSNKFCEVSWHKNIIDWLQCFPSCCKLLFFGIWNWFLKK